jgi:hypothetical protein
MTLFSETSGYFRLITRRLILKIFLFLRIYEFDLIIVFPLATMDCLIGHSGTYE